MSSVNQLEILTKVEKAIEYITLHQSKPNIFTGVGQHCNFCSFFKEQIRNKDRDCSDFLICNETYWAAHFLCLHQESKTCDTSLFWRSKQTEVKHTPYILSVFELVAKHTKSCLYQQINIFVCRSFDAIPGRKSVA